MKKKSIKFDLTAKKLRFEKKVIAKFDTKRIKGGKRSGTSGGETGENPCTAGGG